MFRLTFNFSSILILGVADTLVLIQFQVIPLASSKTSKARLIYFIRIFICTGDRRYWHRPSPIPCFHHLQKSKLSRALPSLHWKIVICSTVPNSRTLCDCPARKKNGGVDELDDEDSSPSLPPIIPIYIWLEDFQIRRFLSDFAGLPHKKNQICLDFCSETDGRAMRGPPKFP